MSEITRQSELDEENELNNDIIHEVDALQVIENIVCNHHGMLRSVDDTYQANFTALNHFNRYFAYRYNEITFPFREYKPTVNINNVKPLISIDYINDDLHDKFGSYLIDVIKIKSCNTCLQYLSKVKVMIETDFPQFVFNAKKYQERRGAIAKEYRTITLGNIERKCVIRNTRAAKFIVEDLNKMVKFLIDNPKVNDFECRDLITKQWRQLLLGISTNFMRGMHFQMSHIHQINLLYYFFI
jgi:hypothetical protein